ncbi:cation:proton antiporter domain-containing protein [Pelagerythrobacter marinus]|uniref:cation:proton antiporter domain-containing protein n=1 Tax=Pelagerythrobacter marinus TaxID=538382 RepID=UPI0020373265|nr:cation:proton antiporter [Pelagerythrobacter marinus]USA40627.1 cation:proton antiporter [Pelagerythrobacter marinus]WPZ08203.1 cation:proton antiporter [Pelagerythrobacter marinus]
MTDFLVLAFIIMVAGVAAVPLATRFGLGSVLGYLLAGMALSPLLSALRVDVEGLQVFAEFGVVMMLFIVGLELEPRKLWDMRRQLLGLGGGQVVATTLVLAGAVYLAGEEWRTALAIGMILALSSTAIIVQTLTEKGLLKSEGGESSFSVLLFQDVAVIPILALLPFLALPEIAATAGAAAGEAAHAHAGIDLTEGMPVWLSGLVTLAAIGAVVLIGAYLTRPVFRFIAAAQLRELFTAAALVFVIGIALLMTLVGLSPALGTFLAGVVLANSEYRHELESDIEPFKGLLLGLFFITVGAGIDFALAIANWATVLGWALAIIAIKAAILAIIARIAGLRRQSAWLFSLSLAQAGEFAFVLISFAVANFVLDGETADMLLLIVALTMLATPLLFIAYDKLIAAAYCRGEQREADTIDEDNRIIIAGRGRVGGIVDRMLDAAGYRATVIDYDSTHLEHLKKFGVKSYFGDATRPDLLASAGIARARLLIVALDEREQIDKLVRYAIRNFPHLHVIARAIDRDHVYHLWAMGCRDVIRETYDAALRMGRSAYEALGADRQAAIAMRDAFEEMDRSSMREVAELYREDVPAWDNEPLLAKVRELRAEWDPKLREMMDDIIGRGR